MATESRAPSAGRIVLLMLLAAIAAWYFLPGLFDPNAKSLLGSKNRRSPVANAMGPRTIVNESLRVGEDEFHRFHFSLNIPSNVSVSVTGKSGPEFDVLVMDAEGYNQWSRATDRMLGGDYTYRLKGSGSNVSRAGGLEAGDYVLVIDNTDYGDAAPPMNMRDDAVEVHVKLTVE